MSKKKKFKQKFKNQILEQIQQESSKNSNSTESTVSAVVEKNNPQISEQTQIISPYVRQDLKKIAILIGSIIVILFIITRFGSSWINSFSNVVTNFVHLNK